jgi:hypothetical protein
MFNDSSLLGPRRICGLRLYYDVPMVKYARHLEWKGNIQVCEDTYVGVRMNNTNTLSVVITVE